MKRRHGGIAAAALVLALGGAVLAQEAKTKATQDDAATQNRIIEILKRQNEILHRQNLITDAEYKEISSLADDAAKDDAASRAALEQEIDRFVQEAQAKAAAPTDAATNLQTGYKDGFYLKSADNNYALTIGGFVQWRYTYADFTDKSSGSGSLDPQISKFTLPVSTDTNTIDLRRARVSFQGNVFDPTIKYKAEIETEGAATLLTDFYIDYTRFDPFDIKLGQFKVPFGRQQLTNDTKLQFMERSRETDFFTPARGGGAGGMAYGSLGGENKDLFEYYGGIFNGEGQNVGTNDGPGLMYAARVAVNPLGAYGYDEADLDRSANLKATVGGGVVWDADDNVNIGAVNIGGADTTTFGVDAGLKWMGVAVTGEYFNQELNPDDDAIDKFKTDGWYAQAGWLIPGCDLEVAGRYGETDDKDGIAGSTGGNYDEYSLGANYYFKKHRAKIEADWTHLTNDPDGSSKAENDLFRIQVQLMF